MVHEGGVHRLHSLFKPSLDEGGDLRNLSLPDHVRQSRRPQEDLVGGAPALAVFCRQELLSNDGLDGVAQHRSHLALLVGGKGVDDAVDRLGGAVRMQGSENQDPQRGAGQRERNRLKVPHLADQNDVGVFPGGDPECIRETAGVRAGLPLRDETLDFGMNELDGVFDRKDVGLPGLVDLVDDRGQRRAFSAARRTGYDHETPLQVGDLVKHGRQSQVGDREDLGRNDAEDGADSAVLKEEIAAEPRHSFQFIRGIEVPVLLEDVPLLGRQDFVEHLREGRIGEYRSGRAVHLAFQPEDGRIAHGQMQIAPSRFQQLSK